MKVKIKHTVEIDAVELLALIEEIIAAAALTYDSPETEKNAMVALLTPKLNMVASESFDLGKKMSLSDVKDDAMYT